MFCASIIMHLGLRGASPSNVCNNLLMLFDVVLLPQQCMYVYGLHIHTFEHDPSCALQTCTQSFSWADNEACKIRRVIEVIPKCTKQKKKHTHHEPEAGIQQKSNFIINVNTKLLHNNSDAAIAHPKDCAELLKINNQMLHHTETIPLVSIAIFESTSDSNWFQIGWSPMSCQSCNQFECAGQLP